MSTGTLSLSDSFAIPTNAVVQKISFLGRTGSGKSHGACVMAEQMLAANLQVVILDPVGVWYGLRSGARATLPGFAIPVLGGLHGDIPITPHSGVIAADLAVDTGTSLVIDVSQMESDADKTRFATAFASRFFYRKKASPSPVHLIIDECQEFIPQNPQRGEEGMLHAFQRMWKLGRNFGIGGSLISQRPQEVSKKALNQTELLFCFQMTGKLERKAIEEWTSEKGVEGTAMSITTLEVGQCYAWSPQWLRVSEKMRFGEKQTANTSATPEAGTAPRKRVVAEINLDRLREQMQMSEEDAKANDPEALKKRIRELEVALKKEQEKKPIAVEIPKIEIKEVPLFTDLDRTILNELNEQARGIVDFVAKIESHLDAVKKAYLAPTIKVRAATPIKSGELVVVDPSRPDFTKPHPVKIHKPVKDHYTEEAKEGSAMGRCERAILTALAQHGPCLKGKLAACSQYSVTSSSFKNALSVLRASEYIERGEPVAITDAGVKALGHYDPLPTGRDLIRYWQNQLPKCESEILDVLKGQLDPISKDEIAGMTGYSVTSSSFKNALSNLRTRELITRGNPISLSENLR